MGQIKLFRSAMPLDFRLLFRPFAKLLAACVERIAALLEERERIFRGRRPDSSPWAAKSAPAAD